MKSTVHFSTAEQRNAQREKNLRCALRTRWRLLALVSFLRMAMTQVLPLAGASGWWLCAGSLLGALIPYWVCLGLMKRLHASTLQDALRASFGKGGVYLACLLAAATLLWDGACTLTALVTLFTQGIGARGTQFTLAVLSCAAVLFCLNRDGQSYGLQLLRWPLWAFLLLAAVCAPMRTDHLFPLGGQGISANLQALQAGAGLGWPLLLLLMEEPVAPSARWRDPLPAYGLGLAALALTTLTVPHEIMVQHATLAQSMLLPVMFLPQAAELTTLCLWMVGLFLLLSVEVRSAADALQAPAGRNFRWLAGAFAALLALSQLIPAEPLWQVLSQAQRWMILPLHVCLWALAAGCVKHRRRA